LLASSSIVNGVELDGWKSQPVGEVEIVLTPVQHGSVRSFNNRMKTLWGGYALFARDFQVFFSGDTGCSRDFAGVSARFAARRGERGFDRSLLPVGASEPRWFMREQHVNPEEAARTHHDPLARRSLGIHSGTSELTDEPPDEPPQVLTRAPGRRSGRRRARRLGHRPDLAPAAPGRRTMTG